MRKLHCLCTLLSMCNAMFHISLLKMGRYRSRTLCQYLDNLLSSILTIILTCPKSSWSIILLVLFTVPSLLQGGKAVAKRKQNWSHYCALSWSTIIDKSSCSNGVVDYCTEVCLSQECERLSSIILQICKIFVSQTIGFSDLALVLYFCLYVSLLAYI